MDNNNDNRPVRRRSNRLKKKAKKDYNEGNMSRINNNKYDTNYVRRSQRIRKQPTNIYEPEMIRRRKNSNNNHNNNDNNRFICSSDDNNNGSNNDNDSNSSTDSEQLRHEYRKLRRMVKNRSKIKPINLNDMGIYKDNIAPKMKKGNYADISPMNINLNVNWENIGGLKNHIKKLKEMVMLPLLYSNEFNKFKMSTPKGVLFYGPPGTGKTLVARVLASECSKYGKKVNFYMRKGADCLSKWVGEAERQLRLLFDEAYKNQPSIIFFDEIDGLAPVRSSKQDQIHSSIVSTLLALMDGLDSRGQIIIIGATNRYILCFYYVFNMCYFLY